MKRVTLVFQDLQVTLDWVEVLDEMAFQAFWVRKVNLVDFHRKESEVFQVIQDCRDFLVTEVHLAILASVHRALRVRKVSKVYLVLKVLEESQVKKVNLAKLRQRKENLDSLVSLVFLATWELQVSLVSRDSLDCLVSRVPKVTPAFRALDFLAPLALKVSQAHLAQLVHRASLEDPVRMVLWAHPVSQDKRVKLDMANQDSRAHPV